eukprot:SM000009S23467  [mRNA]  locus=s9:165803:168511:- [translate_table: standard]
MSDPRGDDASMSTDRDGDPRLDDGQTGGTSSDHEQKNGDSKGSQPQALRRLAQNREAARKSRLRKKAYVQQLETSRVRLQQLEQELQRARQQIGTRTGDAAAGQAGAVLGPNANANLNPATPAGTANLTLPIASNSPGAAAFDVEYARWVEEHHRQMCDLRAALQSRLGDAELRVLVDGVMAQYEELFKLKAAAAKADVFHLVSGMWKTPAERCFMWMGGFRPSELLKILIPQIEPLNEQQLHGICNLQQSSQQAEDALTQGMEALQQSLADTLSAGSLGASSNVANYMGQMAMAMGKLGTLESFVRQADSLRHETLQQMHRILTTRQAARGLLAMGDYFARLRALSSLWSARPRE